MIMDSPSFISWYDELRIGSGKESYSDGSWWLAMDMADRGYACQQRFA